MQQSTCSMTKLRRYDGTSLFVVVPTAFLLVVNPVIEYNSLSPGHSQILSCSCGRKLGEGLGSLLRHGPEMVDTVSTN